MATYSGVIHLSAGKIRRTGLALLPRQQEASMVIGERLFTPSCRLGIVATLLVKKAPLVEKLVVEDFETPRDYSLT
ncbi:hypothetical protein D3C81_1900080 [compost metagenome]